MKDPLVSVIIAAYNCEQYIERCVKSIENQTYKNIEIIICDDCSTDKTRDILKKLEREYDNIKVLYNEKNLKAAAARNNCINCSKGDFIAIQDSDDYSDIHRIERQVEFLKLHNDIEYVSTSAIICDEKGEKGKRIVNEKILTNQDFFRGLPIIHPTTMFRKSALEKVNGYWVDKTTIRMEDSDMIYRMQVANIKGAKISDCLYYYNENDDAYRRRKYKYRINEFLLRKRYFKKLGFNFFKRLFICRPLIVGLIPTSLRKLFRRVKEKNNE